MAAAVHPVVPSFNSSKRRSRSSLRPDSAPAKVVRAREPSAFPEASAAPTLSMSIPDEVLELYAFTFCQGGFRKLGMTFEQFLLVAAAIKPLDLRDARDDAWAF